MSTRLWRVKSGKLGHLVLATAAVLLCACEGSVHVNLRSGSTDDDYVEEPLPATFEKYEQALLLSNRLIERLRDGDVEAMRSELFSGELRSAISTQELRNLVSQTMSTAGPIENYKKNQWGFISFNEDARDYLGSVKIVEHEKGMVKYLVIFNADGQYQEVVGFRLKNYEGVTRPGVF